MELVHLDVGQVKPGARCYSSHAGIERIAKLAKILLLFDGSLVVQRTVWSLVHTTRCERHRTQKHQ